LKVDGRQIFRTLSGVGELLNSVLSAPVIKIEQWWRRKIKFKGREMREGKERGKGELVEEEEEEEKEDIYTEP
jgi:hypothetical protein